jgi:DNA-binding beta-propeller fold protein YncE
MCAGSLASHTFPIHHPYQMANKMRSRGLPVDAALPCLRRTSSAHRRRAAAALAWLLAATIVALAHADLTLAATGHELLLRITEGPSGVALDEPGAVAVDHASGEVFVADRARGVVDVFSSSGQYLSTLGEDLEAQAIAVDEASGDVYVAEPLEDVVLIFKPDGPHAYSLLSRWSGSGTPDGGFGEVTSVAVDNSTSAADPSAGDVYVVDAEDPVSGHGAVDVLEPRLNGPEEAQEGTFVRTLAGVRLEDPNGVAVSAQTGTAYVADSVRGLVYQFGATGMFERKLNGAGSPRGSLRGSGQEGDVTALALDEETGDLFVAAGEAGVVEELNPAGEWVGWITGTPSGPFGAPAGVATTASGEVYVGDGTLNSVDLFGAGVNVPTVTTVGASTKAGVAAVVKGDVDGDGEAARYYFEWGETEAYGKGSTPVGESSGAAEEKVQAALANLKPDTTYYYRLVAENGNGINCGVGRAFATAPASEPSVTRAARVSCQLRQATVDSESALDASSTEATLQAWIDPRGHDTTYRFQYGTESCQASLDTCTSAPGAPVDIGAGESDVSASVSLQHLLPSTTYHYRVIASNSVGVAEAAERTFTTQGASKPPSLPDGRFWELVSPPNKHGAAIEPLTKEGGLIRAAVDGNALTYVANGAITEQAEGNRSFEPQQVLATRTPSGWSSQDIATPQARALGSNSGPTEFRYFSPDLSLSLVEPYLEGPPLAPEATQESMYVRDDPPLAPESAERGLYEQARANSVFQAPGYLPLVTGVNAPEAVFPLTASFLGATPDLSSVVLNSSTALTGPSSGPGLYEWSAGKLHIVSELPNGTLAPEPEVVLGYDYVQANAISTDGTRVIWTSSLHKRGHLYMRDTATETTVQLDAEVGVSESEQPEGSAQFQAASSDGSRVFFTDKQRLTPDSSAEPEEVNATGKVDLYECTLVEEHGELACHLQDLTADVLRASQHAAVQGMLLGASENGSTVYLVAHGVLAANKNGDGERAAAGMNNLYEIHQEGASWATTFIAMLSNIDSPDWDQGENVLLGDSAFLAARVSPNGRYLAFMSQMSLTGYDNEDVSSEKLGERLDEEVYLYDSQAAKLTCVSCDPTGARPTGVLDEQNSGEGLGLLVDRREIWKGRWLAGDIPGWTAQSLESALFQSRYLSNEGRLFFNSADTLVPQVTVPARQEEVAGKLQSVGVENVYEYEPAGVGTCTSASGGCDSLLSSGTSGLESAFLETTPNGDDAFFLTAARLLAQDTDTAFDIYDARVCTAESPCLTPPPPEASSCTTAATCHPGSSSAQPPIEASGSATLSGTGNVTRLMSSPQQGVRDVKTTAKPLTRAQRLEKALALCRKEHPHSRKRRQFCEAHARVLYGPKHRAKTKAKAKSEQSAGHSSQGVSR